MRNKPVFFSLFPIIALLLAIGFPVQIYILYSIPMSDLPKIFSMLTPLNLITMFFFVTAACFTANLNKHIYKVIPILLITVLVNDYIVAAFGHDYSYKQVFISFFALGLLILPFYKKQNKEVLLNPSLQWWATPKRYDLSKQIEIKGENYKIFGESLNISSSGIFTLINEPEIIETLGVDEIVNLKIMDEIPINVKAKIVRKSNGENQPLGCGLQFIQNNDLKLRFNPWFKKATQELY